MIERALAIALVPDPLDGFAVALVVDAFKRSGLAFSLSTLVLLWSASKGVKALRRGLNAAFGVQETRSGLAVVGISILVTAIMGILLAAIMYLVFSDSIIRVIEEVIPDVEIGNLSAALNPVVTFALGALVLDVCYAFLPAGTRRLSAQLPGAVFSSFAWGVLAFGFHVYVEYFSNVTVLYGSIAAVALLLMWMYFAVYIVIAGGFINRVLAERP